MLKENLLSNYTPKLILNSGFVKNLKLHTHIMLDNLNSYDIVNDIFESLGFKPTSCFVIIRCIV